MIKKKHDEINECVVGLLIKIKIRIRVVGEKKNRIRLQN